MKKLVALLLTLSMMFALCGCGGTEGNYKKATGLLNKGEYDAAKELFEELGDYKDSKVKLCICLIEQTDYNSRNHFDFLAASAASDALKCFQSLSAEEQELVYNKSKMWSEEKIIEVRRQLLTDALLNNNG